MSPGKRVGAKRSCKKWKKRACKRNLVKRRKSLINVKKRVPRNKKNKSSPAVVNNSYKSDDVFELDKSWLSKLIAMGLVGNIDLIVTTADIRKMLTDYNLNNAMEIKIPTDEKESANPAAVDMIDMLPNVVSDLSLVSASNDNLSSQESSMPMDLQKLLMTDSDNANEDASVSITSNGKLTINERNLAKSQMISANGSNQPMNSSTTERVIYANPIGYVNNVNFRTADDGNNNSAINANAAGPYSAILMCNCLQHAPAQSVDASCNTDK